MNQPQNSSLQLTKNESDKIEETFFSEIILKSEFAEFEKISKILQLMNSLDTSTKTSYRIYIAGDTAG